jgi:hypothetical protein
LLLNTIIGQERYSNVKNSYGHSSPLIDYYAVAEQPEENECDVQMEIRSKKMSF